MDKAYSISWLLLFLWVSVTDIKQRKILNIQLIFIFCLALFGVVVKPLDGMIMTFTTVFILLLIALIPYFFNIWGGGDSKLLIAASPYFYFNEILPYLITVLFSGGLLSCFYYVKYRLCYPSLSDPGVPYGCAITFGIFYISLVR